MTDLQTALATTWAMEEGAHRRLAELFREPEARRLLLDAMPDRAPVRADRGGVATIPIHGVIGRGRGWFVGAAVPDIRADLEAALADDEVRAILLDIDSPGGTVAGVDDLAADIREARKYKPIVAATSGVMASAAYWLASQATRVVATRSSTVGSIGVIASFLDAHRALANEGLDPVVIKSVPAKGGVQGNGTISDADREEVQREVDAIHALFVEAVADGRNIDREKAAAMGDGRVYLGAEALERGYVDAIKTLAQARGLARALGRQTTSKPAAVAGVFPEDSQEREPMAKQSEGAATVEQAASSDQERTEQQTEPVTASGDNGSQAVEAERARAAAILEAADSDQRTLAQQLVASGTSLVEALQALIRDRRSRMTPPASASLGAGNRAAENDPAKARAAAIAAMRDGPDKWKAEFEADEKLQAEFGELAFYVGWKRNEINAAAAKARKEN